MIARSTRLIAPVSLGLAGILLLVMSTPPWFNMIFGEEYTIYWPGIALAIPQLAIAALMLRGSGVATVAGVAVAFASLLVNGLLLMFVQGSAEGSAAFATSSALYVLLIAGALVDGWHARSEQPSS